jgi:hypothetical protein
MDRLKIDNDWFGVAIAVLLPPVIYSIASGVEAIIHRMISHPFLLILCIGTNFLPFNWYSKRGYNKTARGIVLVTILMAFAFFYYKIYVLKEN